MNSFADDLTERLASQAADFYAVCGFVTRDGRVYPLDSDSKVLGKVFEYIARPIIFDVAATWGFQVMEPLQQNYYPDFTMMRDIEDRNKKAIDVKTTYRGKNGTFDYTLGSIRDNNTSKNIVFPGNHYSEHWVVGFVYDRVTTVTQHLYDVSEIGSIPLPFTNVELFVQEKWRIAGGRPGSHNTKNIGSMKGTIEDFRAGAGKFSSYAEYDAYWRDYQWTSVEPKLNYNGVVEVIAFNTTETAAPG